MRRWIARNAFNDLIAEPQSRLWIILKSQSLFQDSCKKGGVTSWLLLWVEFSEHRAQLGVALQDGLQIFVEQRFVDALREVCHAQLFSNHSGVFQREDWQLVVVEDVSDLEDNVFPFSALNAVLTAFTVSPPLSSGRGGG